MTTGRYLGRTSLKATGLGAVSALVLAGGLAASPGGDEPGSVEEAYQRVVQRAATDHRCAEAAHRDAQAGWALVRTPDGSVRAVSFERGWDVYNGRRPGRLVAVCLDDRQASTPRMLRVEQRLTG